MSISLLAAAVATLAGLALTVALGLRCARTGRADLAAWMIAALGLVVALAAQALGYRRGFGPASFRAVWLGAEIAAPMGLIWGLAEVTARGAGARFAARLAVAALTVVGGVILATDPLSTTAFGQTWPAASSHYQLIPQDVLDLLAVVTVIWVLVTAITVAVRSRRGPQWGRLLPAALAAFAVVLLVQALRVSLPAGSAYPVFCLIAIILIWYAGRRAGGIALAGLHADEFAAHGGRGRRGRYEEYGDDTGYGGLYRPGTGFSETGAGGEAGYGFYRTDTGGFAVDTGGFGPETGYNLYQAGTGSFEPVGNDTGESDAGEFDQMYRAATHRGAQPGTAAGGAGPGGGAGAPGMNGPVPGLVETGDFLPAMDALAPPDLGSAGTDTSQLYGQIAIYTLLEDRAEEFDRLAKDVVDQVKQHEPQTLVYVMHAVPSAPMQRILYEVYQDAEAFEEHSGQPYIEHFEELRRPFVLATNVIELGVRQAKVVPLEGEPPAGHPGPDIWGRGHR